MYGVLQKYPLHDVPSVLHLADPLLGAAGPDFGGDEGLLALRDVGEAARSVRVLADYLEQHPEAMIRGK